MLLNPLSDVKGIGAKTQKDLVSLLNGGSRIFDLLLHKPHKIEKIAFQPRLFEVENNQLIIIKAKVESHRKPTKPKSPYKVTCYTPTGFINLVFFKIFPYQIKQMPLGKEIAILGVLQKKSGENQISHPEIIVAAEEVDKIPKIKLTYPLKFPISNNLISKKIQQILGDVKKISQQFTENKYEWIDENLKSQRNWPGLLPALLKIHLFEDSDISPQTNQEVKLSNQRLSYDEFLAWQIAFMLAKKQKKSKKSNNEKQHLPAEICQNFIQNLNFELTSSQLSAIKELSHEISSNKKMLRLLQGDVGSGKTIIAIISCLQAISLKKQCCVLCPTTVLAKQHFAYFIKFLAGLENIKIELLTSATTKKQKEKLQERLANHDVDILISTHAVLEDNINFSSLGFVVIDEQHRFGVVQRLKLVSKGQNVDTLLMSATPIPRSLMMSFYGDMDITILKEKPKNRQEIQTVIMSEDKRPEIFQAINRTVEKGEKIYWICPAIDNQETEEQDIFGPENLEKNDELANVKDKYQELKQHIEEKHLAVIHGKMKDKEKDQIMKDFADPLGNAKILIATTVIEVGIDVPDATVIVIENAERFGLAQLHQIRGRVGRSDKKSFCILLYGKKFGKNGVKRLSILKNSNDGFYIADQDLKMRGSGDLIGTRQSGFPDFKIANPEEDYNLMEIAHEKAKTILEQEQDNILDHNNKYNYLIRLFGYDECLELVKGG